MTAVAVETNLPPSSWFERILLPGFAFKAVIIGGGYATGRELAEFFLPSGPWAGVAGMVLAMVLWSLIAAVTFAYAQATRSFDYRSFFCELLGPGWVLFEIAYGLFVMLILSVFGAAAGAIGEAMFGLPAIVGTLALAACIAGFVAFGNSSVERLFKYATIFLYAVYAVFLVLALSRFGEQIATNFAAPVPVSVSAGGWVTGGITYASYNVVGAVVILPVLRHLTSRRDALISGAIAGPLAMAPAILFFVAMIAFYPDIGTELLPSDFLLRQMGVPLFHLLFQLMIFAALLESGVGAVHSINERIASVLHARSRALDTRARILISAALLIGCIFVADRFGLVTLIAHGYRALAGLFLIVYVLPLLTLGVVRLIRRSPRQSLKAGRRS